jgi:hypothetical protein
MRTAWKVFAALAVLAIGFSGPAWASVPKIVFCDEFGYPS